MSVSISPVFNGFQFFDNDGFPLSGGKLFQYEAGSTSVEQTTYADSGGSVPNANPIILDSSGRLLADLWLEDGLAYNLVLTQSDGTTVLTGVDNVVGVVSSSASSGSLAVWTLVEDPPAFVGPTQFLIPGNLTTEFKVGNRVQIEYTANSFKYGTVSAVSYSSPNTQVTLVNDSSVQNSGMTAAYWSVLVNGGRTVDAGAITWNVPSTYSTPLTVGYELLSLNQDVTDLNNRVDGVYKVWTATGTTTYAITPNPSITGYGVGMIFDVKFTNASGASPTINVNSLGAKPLKQYTSSGTLTDAIITAGMVAHIAYDGSNFMVVTPLPPVAPGVFVPPHGIQTFVTNGTFTVPANVYSVKVTCIAGGGGGGSGWYDPFYDITTVGGNGGYGGSGVKQLSVTPGGTHAVTIGTGGNGGTGGSNGSPGTSTTFGASLVVSTGGNGGIASGLSNGANGTDGYGSTSDFSYSHLAFKKGTAVKGAGGAGAVGPTYGPVNDGLNGMIIVEW